MLKKVASLILLLFCLTAGRSQASHIVGATITYECVGQDTFRVYFDAVRWCAGAPLGVPNGLLIEGPSMSCVSPTAIGAWSPFTVKEITPVAPSTITTCSGGTIQGFEQLVTWRDYDFTGTNCVDYTMSWTTCCRTGNITSGAANQSMYVQSGSIDPTGGPCANSSPEWRRPPFLYMYQSGPMTYDIGATDPDGDSLSYALGPCFAASNTNMVTYNAGYTPTQPLGPSWNVQINPTTGWVTFLPQPGNLVVAVVCEYVSEWRNGQLIGQIARDLYVVTTPGTQPTNGAAPMHTGMTNPTGGGMLMGDTLVVPPNANICVDFTTDDPDAGDYLRLYPTGLYPGMVFSDTNGTAMSEVNAEDPIGRICWTTPAPFGVYPVEMNVEDSLCTINTVYQRTYTLIVGDTALVWPGDANDDHVANNLDLLALGLAFGSTGPTRANASNNWVGQMSLPWMDTIPGPVNKKHQDCNGDGTVDANDTLALSLNYGNTHNKGNVAARGQATDPPLRIILPDSANVGDTIHAPIVLGDSAVPASNVYGLAFSLSYDAALIDSTSFGITFDPSWMGTVSNSLSMSRNLFHQTRCDGAHVRTDHQNVSGMGQIGTAHFIIIDNIDGKMQTLTTDTLPIAFFDVTLIGVDGELLAVDPIPDSLIVYQLSTESTTNPIANDIAVYPNPAQNLVTVRAGGQTIETIRVHNMQGQLVGALEGNGRDELRFDTRQFADGMYFLTVGTNAGIRTRRLVIRH